MSTHASSPLRKLKCIGNNVSSTRSCSHVHSVNIKAFLFLGAAVPVIGKKHTPVFKINPSCCCFCLLFPRTLLQGTIPRDMATLAAYVAQITWMRSWRSGTLPAAILRAFSLAVTSSAMFLLLLPVLRLLLLQLLH
ncbi:hypothetical protein TcCL_ESM12901, partial [Trypanosoma cruzi]